jgi:hypothetical protein
VKSEESVKLENREEKPKRDPRRNEEDVLWPLDEVGEELERASEGEPDKVRDEDVPGGEKVASEDGRESLTGRRTDAEVDDEDGTGEEGEGVEELVDHRVAD